MITIDYSKCTRCLHCVKICPAGIFVLSEEKSVEVKDEHRCINCGHCVAACDFGAITHETFPPEKIHTIDREQLLSPEQTLLLIRKRRSNRAFSSKPVPEEFWQQILEAAHRAPTASNAQKVGFTLITDPDKLKVVIEFTLNTFESSLKRIDNFMVRPLLKRFMPDVYNYLPMFKKMKRDYREKGKDGILRGATSLIFIHAPKVLSFGRDDCNLAYQNASLMAESLGVSQFYTGFVLRAVRQNKGKLEKLLGIDGVIHAGLAMGMPLFECSKYIDRQDISVKYLK
jgi:nitroreductase/NAD-dependent dihydropyrimidine dehydrogenase PreA subunit